MKLASFLIALLIFGSAASISGTPNAIVSDRVWMVRTSGTWRLDSRAGYYRVVVERDVGEAALDTVHFQILEISKTSGQPILSSTTTIASPAYLGNVIDIGFTPRGDTEIAVSLDVLVRGMDGIVQREIYLFGPNRSPKRIIGAKFIDLDD